MKDDTVSSTQTVHPVLPLTYPERTNRAWYSWMVVKIIALRLKVCRVKPSNISIPSFHRVFISCIRGSWKTSISMSGCLGPCIRMDNRWYFLFWHNHVGRLYIISITSHMLWVLLLSQNFFHKTNSFNPYSMQTEHCPGHSQISDSTSHQIPSTVEHQLDVGAFCHSSYAYLNPTIASVHHPLGSRRNASGD